MEIIRNGIKIKLTDDEIRSVLRSKHTEEIRFEVEDAMKEAEENGWISFDSWQDCPFADYSSESDAREDFIEYIIEHVLESEENDYCYPDRYIPNYGDLVADNADDFGYWRC